MNVPLPIVQVGTNRPNYALGPRSLEAVKLLRISVTDRCNLRCSYCMPADGVDFDDQSDHLSAGELLTVAQAAASVGVTHFKITGGEPTVRRDLLDIIRGVARLNPVDLSMTTNGLRLAQLAGDLRQAGLDRLTVSWDSMKPDRLARITGADRMANRDNMDPTVRGSQLLERIRDGILAATDVGFKRLKINVVVMAGVNDDEIVDFARLTFDNPWTVRFIEYMPLGDSQLVDESDDYVLDNQIVMSRIAAELGELQPIDRGNEAGVGPANVFRLPDAMGRLGFISAMSKPFCESCNRLRLTARGELRACLFDGGEVDVLPALRPTPDASVVADLMKRCVLLKPDTHSARGNRAMSQLGG